MNASRLPMDASMFAPRRASTVPAALSPKLEVISKLPSRPCGAPPILFVHGAWHAAWCWDEFFLDYFAAHGFEAHALSLRAHGASEGRAQLHRSRIRHYVEDVEAVAAALPTGPFVLAIQWAALLSKSSLRPTCLRRRFCSPAFRPTGRGRYMRGSCGLSRSTCSGRMDLPWESGELF
jgi:Alpha/beta hydrolase family